MAGPATPIGAPPGAPSRRRRRWLRRALWLLGLAVVILAVLHTPAAKRLVSARLLGLAGSTLGADVRSEGFDYRLWAGELRVRGLTLRRPQLEVSCAEIDARWRPGRGWRVRLARPRVVVVLRPDEPDSAGLPWRPWTVVDRLEWLDLKGGSLELRDATETPWLQLDGIDAKIARPKDRPQASLRIAEGGLGWPGAGVRARTARGEAVLEIEPATGALRIAQARLELGRTRLEATGELAHVDPVAGRARGRAVIDATLIHDLLPEVEAEGSLDADLAVESDGSGARGTIEARTAAILVDDVGPLQGTVHGRIEGPRLLVERVDLTGYDARITGGGSLSLGDGTSGLDLKIQGLDVAAFVRSFVDTRPPLASQADATLRLALTGWETDTLEGQGVLSFRPIAAPGWPVAGPARFRLSQGRLVFGTDELRVRDARLSLDGSLTLSGDLAVGYHLRLDQLPGGPALLRDVGLSAPGLALGGAIAATGRVEGRLPEWTATAALSGAAVSIEGIDLGLEGSLRATRGGIEIETLRMAGADGAIEVGGSVPLDPSGRWDVHGAVHELQVTEVLARGGVPLATTVQGRFDVGGTGADPEAAFELDARVYGAEDASGNEGNEKDRERAARAPARLLASGTASRHAVALDRVTGELGGGTATGSVTWSLDDETLAARLQLVDVHLAQLPAFPSLAADLDATVGADVELSGAKSAPAGRLTATASRLTYRGRALPELSLAATSDGRELTLTGRAGDRPLLAGRLPLDDPWPLRLEVEMDALPLTEVLRARPAFEKAGVGVALTGQARIEIPLREPKALRYDARVASLDLKLREAWTAGPFVVRGGLNGTQVEGLVLRGADASVSVEGSLGTGVPTETPLTIRGELPLRQLTPLLPNAEIGGHAAIELRLAGDLAAPDATGTVRVTDSSGRVGRLSWSDLQVDGAFDRGLLTLTTARARLLGGEVNATGRLPFGPRAAGQRHEVEFALRGLDLAGLAPAPDEETRFSAPLEASGRIALTSLDLESVEAEARLTRLGLAAQGQELNLEAPVEWLLRAGQLTHTPLRLRGPNGYVELQGEADLRASPPAARVRLTGDNDLAVLNPLFAGAIGLAGRARYDFSGERGPDGVVLRGEGRVEDARLVLKDPPLAVSGLTGTLRASGRSIELVDWKGAVGDGELNAGGRARFTDDGLALDVALRAERLPVEYPEGLRSRSSGQLRLSGSGGAFRLEGDVVVRNATYQREIDRTSQSLDRLGSDLDALDARGSLASRIQLAVSVRIEDGLRVDNSQARLVVDGALQVGGDLATPEVRGVLTLREGGTVQLSRAELRITQGRVELAGYPARPPELDVEGRTQVTGVHIDARLSGPLDEYQLSLVAPGRSDLTQGDLATLMLTGRTASAAASASGTIVAEELAASLGQALDKKLRGPVFVDVSRDESLIVEDTNPSQRFNIGVPITRFLYVIYSQALDSGDRRWIIEFRPGGQFRLRFIEYEDGSYATEVSHRFSLNLWSRGKKPARAKEPRSRIREVVLEGVAEGDAARLRERIDLGEGDAYDYFKGEEASRRLREELRKQGYLAAVVDHRERPADGGRVEVTFTVTAGPRIRLAWRGDDPGKKARERVETGFETSLPVEETAKQLAITIRHLLQTDGYYVAVVEASTDGSEGEIQVAFDVRRGPRGHGVALRFEGNTSVSSEVLAAALPDRRQEAFFALVDAGGRSRLLSAVRLAYAQEGFLKVQVGRPRTAYDARSGSLSVTLPVQEGERSRVVTLDLPAEVRTPEAQPSPQLRLREGEPFRLDAYVADRATLMSWYRDQGYPEARIVGILEPVEGGLDVRFAADPGPRPRAGELRLARAGRTREAVVEEAVTVEPGDLVRPTELARSRDNLSETRSFRSVDVRAEPKDADDQVRDIVVDLVERNDLEVEYSVRYTTGGAGPAGGDPSDAESQGLHVGGAIEAVNPFGWGHRYRLYGLLGSERTFYGLSFDAATFFGRRWQTQVFLFNDEDRELEIEQLAQRIRGTTFQQAKRWRSALEDRRWHDRLRMQWGYSFKNVRYTALETSEMLEGDRAGPFVSLVGDSRDSFTDPHRGLFWSASSELGLRPLGSDVNYVKLYGQFFAYIPFGRRVVWAQGVRLGYVPGDDPLLLLERRFRAGGATTVRGFEESGLGPQTADGESLGGQALAVFNQELRFPIWSRLHGGIFYDAGNVFALSRELSLGALRHSLGAGLRVMFPFGPVRVDWGYVLDAKEGEQRSRWLFTIGHAF